NAHNTRGTKQISPLAHNKTPHDGSSSPKPNDALRTGGPNKPSPTTSKKTCNTSASACKSGKPPSHRGSQNSTSSTLTQRRHASAQKSPTPCSTPNAPSVRFESI